MYSIRNGTNTVSVMTSWRIFSFDRSITVYPMRFAGTCSMYSRNAMPQLTIAATYHGRSLKLRRCAYHANVMNTFDRVSRPTVVRTTPIRKSLSPVLGEDCPALVVAPASVDLEVARRQSLAPESKFVHQCF